MRPILLLDGRVIRPLSFKFSRLTEFDVMDEPILDFHKREETILECRYRNNIHERYAAKTVIQSERLISGRVVLSLEGCVQVDRFLSTLGEMSPVDPVADGVLS